MWLLLMLISAACAESEFTSDVADPAWAEVFASGGMLIGGGRTKRFIALAQDEPDVPHQECMLPNSKIGRCRHLRHCIQDDYKKDIVKFTEYLCIINHSTLGACCPMDVVNIAEVLAGDLPAIASRDESEGAAVKALRAENRGCGVSTRANTRVVGSRPADPREWPWMARVTPEGFVQHCGGVLITDRHVLTAAHCTSRFGPEELFITLGEYDVDKEDESRTYTFRVIEKREHEQYDRSNYHNDIALLKMHRPAVFNSYVWPICLPPTGMSLVNETVYVIGWGMQWYGGPTSTVLMEVSLPVWTRQDCVTAYTEAIFDTNICAGGEGGKDSCQGDSGGPLMYQMGSGRWAVVGVVSWGVGCGQQGRPGIYTSVNSFLPWIIENARF